MEIEYVDAYSSLDAAGKSAYHVPQSMEQIYR